MISIWEMTLKIVFFLINASSNGANESSGYRTPGPKWNWGNMMVISHENNFRIFAFLFETAAEVRQFPYTDGQ